MSVDHWTDEQLIPVRSESELRTGMTVVVKPCGLCGGHHGALILTGYQRDGFPVCRLCLRSSSTSWKVITSAQPCVPGLVTSEACFCSSLPEGRLFRLETGINEADDRMRAEIDRIGAGLRSGRIKVVRP